MQKDQSHWKYFKVTKAILIVLNIYLYKFVEGFKINLKIN